MWQSARPLGNLSFFSSVFLQLLEPQCLESPGSFVEISYRKREDRKMWRKSWAPRSILEKNSQLHYTFLYAWCARENSQHFTVAEAFSPSNNKVASCTWSQVLGWLLRQSVPIARSSGCQVLQWERGQQNGTGAIPAPGSLHACVLSLAQLQLPGQGQGWWPCLSCPDRPVVHLQAMNYRSVASSAEISFLFNVSRGLNLCCLGTAELRVDGVWHSLHEAWINIQERAKHLPELICKAILLTCSAVQWGMETEQQSQVGLMTLSLLGFWFRGWVMCACSLLVSECLGKWTSLMAWGWPAEMLWSVHLF